MFADQAADLFLKSLAPESMILDVGSGQDGAGFGAMVRKAGHVYRTFDLTLGEDWENTATRSLYARRGRHYDGVYMSHSLEHMEDTGSALRSIHNVLKPLGVVAITVPPHKDQIVGGHVSLWNAGLLLYRLILAGFDCSDAAVKTYGYNVSVVVRRVQITMTPDWQVFGPSLHHDSGDIDKLAKYFPSGLGAGDGFDGRIQQHNWVPV